MNQELVIGASVAIAVLVAIGIKTWLHRLLKFKMDESAIQNFLKDSGDSSQSLSTAEISAGTDIAASRVTQVCGRSSAITQDDEEGELWCLRG